MLAAGTKTRSASQPGRTGIGLDRAGRVVMSTVTATVTVPSGSAQLAVTSVGSATPVVLLHPGVADQRCWTDVASALAPSAQVVTYDRRGFGATVYEEAEHTSVRDLEAVLDALQIDRAVLVGNSMGGRAAIDLALAQPGRVRGLVLVAAAIGGAPPPDELPEPVARIDAEIDRLEAAGDLDAVNQLEADLWLDGPSREPGTVGGAARKLFLAMNGQALRAQPTGETEAPETATAWERLAGLAMPVAVLVGSHDLPHIRRRMELVVDRIPAAELTVLDRSAHLPQLDDPTTLTQVLSRFLQRFDS